MTVNNNNNEKQMKTRQYKGFQIKNWSGPYGIYPDRGEPKYYIQSHHHPTQIPMSGELCPHAWSLREAREKINQYKQQAEGRTE